MNPEGVRRIAVTGRGVVAWSAAAAFMARLPGAQVVVVEDPAAPPSLADLTGTAPPSIVDFHRDAGIDERALMREVDAVFRLGSRFHAWNAGAPPYLHCHGEHGAVIAGAAFHHHWLRLHGDAGDFGDYSPATVMARTGAFSHPEAGDTPLARFGYGLHLETAAYAAWLRARALRLGATAVAGPGVPRIDGGRAAGLTMPDGRVLEADLYVDADGALADALDPRRVDWSRWLPAGHAAALRHPALAIPPPADEVEAMPTGWRMAAPLRTATAGLLVSAEAFPGAHRFTQGRRLAPWTGNVVAIGDAAVTLEPLEGVSLHLAHAQIDRVIATLPGRDFARVEVADYNRQANAEADRLRDFVFLHYAVADRPEAMWRDLAATEPPPALADDLRRFRARGHLAIHDGESFSTDSRLSVLIGQGVIPRRVDPVAEELPRATALAALASLRAATLAAVALLPTHRDYLVHYLKGPA